MDNCIWYVICGTKTDANCPPWIMFQVSIVFKTVEHIKRLTIHLNILISISNHTSHSLSFECFTCSCQILFILNVSSVQIQLAHLHQHSRLQRSHQKYPHCYTQNYQYTYSLAATEHLKIYIPNNKEYGNTKYTRIKYDHLYLVGNVKKILKCIDSQQNHTPRVVVLLNSSGW